MFRFLHIGDVHLDTSFLCRSSDLRDRLREALRTSFSRAVDCAIREEVDALLIAGDLFDSDRLSYRTEAFLVDELKRLDENGISTVYVSGNHDPGNGNFAAVAAHVADRFRYIAGNDAEQVDVPGRNGEIAARVVGAGHATASDSRNLARHFPVAADRLPHVGLLHTMITGARDVDEHGRYAPCSVDDLRRTKYRYWALGHIHLRQQVCDQSHAYYSGNLQGRNPKETGPKGGLLVRLTDGMNPDVSFRSFAPIHWMRLEVDDLSQARTFVDLAARVRSAWESVQQAQNGSSGTGSGSIIRLVLDGPTPLFDRLATDEQLRDLESELAAALGVLDVEVKTKNVSRPLDLDEHRGQPHLLSTVLELLEAAQQDPDVLASLIPEPLAGYAGRDDEARMAYVRDLLDGLHHEAAARLLVQEKL